MSSLRSGKVIISCAITGAIHTPSMSPYLPITPEQIAKEAFTLSLSNEDSTDSVISEVVQTIPVNVGMWTCNDIGCSYADDEYVWTSTNSNRILTSALVIFATTILFWIINGEYIAKMVQQEEAIQPV